MRLSYDFRSREQVRTFVHLDGPEPSVFIPTLEPVKLGQQIELDLGLTGQKARYHLLGKAKWFRRGGSGRRVFPGISIACDPAAAITLSRLAHDARLHSFLFARREVRMPCTVNVRIHLPGVRGGHPIAAHLGDLSPHGAFVVLNSFPTGTSSEGGILVELGHDLLTPKPSLLDCQICWIGHLRGQKGFGTSFQRLDSAANAEIGRLLTEAGAHESLKR